MKSLEREGSRNVRPLLTINSVLLLSIAEMLKKALSCTGGSPSSLVLVLLALMEVVVDASAPAFASKHRSQIQRPHD
jgi:hypothetical protein